MVWGSSSLRSCSSLWEKIERNDPSIVNLCILPTKKVDKADWDRCIQAIQRHGAERKLRSIQASGHAIDVDSLRLLSKALQETGKDVAWEEIAIGDSNFGDDGVEALVSAFDADTQLFSLDLSYKNLGSKGLLSLLRWASLSKTLRTLDLSRNADMTKGLVKEQFMDSSCTEFPALEVLNLSDCELEGESGAAVVSVFMPSPKLRILQISNNTLDSSVMNTLSQLPKSIVELSLANCVLSDDMCEKLIPNLSKLESLELLDLSQNSTTAAFAAILAEELANCFPSLKTLNLAGNPFQSSGVATIIEKGLKPRERSLMSLDISATKCDPEAAQLAIETSRVQQLRLFDNALGSKGFNQLASSLHGGHSTLHVLDLAGNNADEEAVVKLLKGLLVRDAGFKSHLKTIIVGGNQGGMVLEELIKEIKTIHPSIDIARDRLRKT